MPTADARKALQELREYFEQKRNLHLRNSDSAADCINTETTKADCYDHAMQVVAAYIGR